MKKLNRDQRGMTLVELIIVIAITGVITAGITVTIFQVFNMNTRTSNHMTAVSQVQHAGKVVSEDILEAQTVCTEGSDLVTLTWSDWETADAYEIVYTLEEGRLWRSESINDGDPTLIRVAEYIDPDGTSCAWDEVERVATFKVTATVGEQSEERTYEVKPRPEA
jgi:prepilin-type N-terminal cleavage/methylation domain-containing protein